MSVLGDDKKNVLKSRSADKSEMRAHHGECFFPSDGKQSGWTL